MQRNALLLCALAALTACSDSTSPGSPLSRDEAIGLLRQSLTAIAPAADSAAAVALLGSSAIAFSGEFSEPCQPSGTVHVDYDVSFASAGGTQLQVDLDMAVSHSDCAHRIDTGEIIKIDGDPKLDVTLHMEGTAGALTSAAVSERGAFRWRRGDSQGRCNVDITGNLNPFTGMMNTSGTFCGFTLSETFPF